MPSDRDQRVGLKGEAEGSAAGDVGSTFVVIAKYLNLKSCDSMILEQCTSNHVGSSVIEKQQNFEIAKCLTRKRATLHTLAMHEQPFLLFCD